ncbi:MAG: hypothetical protein V3T54_00385 [Acidobacteriota bacterium]
MKAGPERPNLPEILENPEDASRCLDIVRSHHPDGDGIVPFLEEQLLEVPDPDRALRNLVQLAESSGLPAERESLFRFLVLFGSSQYLSGILLRNPDFARWLGRFGSLTDRRSREDFAQELARFHFTASGSDDGTILRKFKDREYLRIGLRDYLYFTEVGDTTEELSDLADVLLDKSLVLTQQDLIRSFGIPQFYDPQGRLAEARFTVISLGKLGGRELNYSSDIDLLFLYSHDGETSGQLGNPGTQISNRDWFTRLGEGILEKLACVSEAGRVFRVDMDLRPGGRDGELVQSLSAVQSYYQVWSRGWERQALLKARRSAGDEELGQKFLAAISGLIYRPSADPAFAAEVASIQERMAERLAETQKEDRDLKHGWGGIRELELSLQALQLIHGGQDPWLREGNSLRALHRLSDRQLISTEQHEALARAYAFLRRVEHRLQLPMNRQTFVLPAAPGPLRMLARSMGYRDGGKKREGQRFLADLTPHRRQIREFYESVLGRKAATGNRIQVQEANLFLDNFSAEEMRKSLGKWGFSHPETLTRSLDSLRKTLVPFRSDPQVADPLRRETASILRALSAAPYPRRGWMNLDRFLNSLAREPELLGDFFRRRENPVPIIDLLSRSDYLTEILVHRPGWFQELPSGPEVLRSRSRRQMVRNLRSAWDASTDANEIGPLLCRIQRGELLRIGFRDLQGREGVSRIQRSLAELADAILGEALFAAATSVLGTRRMPRRGPSGFAVLSLGRLANRKIGYLSDLDIVFIRADPNTQEFPFHQEHFRIAEIMTGILSSITQEGYLYPVDLRLRPSGGEGELVPTAGHFLKYFEESAQVWERQSFLRVRPVAGDLRLARRVVKGIENFLYPESSPREIAGVIGQARGRLEKKSGRSASRFSLKLGPGGILDIEFLLEFLQLTTRHRSGPMRDPLTLLVNFRKLGILTEDSCRWLVSGYRFLRDLEHHIQLITGKKSELVPYTESLIQELAVAMDFGTSKKLMTKLAETRRQNRRIFDSFFG